MKPLILLFASLLFLSAFAQKQGIKGQVFWVAGNQMPGPGIKTVPQLGVQREVYIYELTTLNKAMAEEGFFNHISTKLIAKQLTEADGTFKIKLPPGTYSVFVKEPKGLFANLIDKNNVINPVTIRQKQYTWTTIVIDYLAAY